MRNCLKRGVGVTICPEVSVQKELADGYLAKLKWNENDVETSVLMIWHAEKWCSPLLKYFMAISKDIIKVS